MSVKLINSKKGNIFEPTKKAGLLCLAVEEIQIASGASLECKDSKFGAGKKARRIAFIFRTQEEFTEIFASMNVVPKEGVELPGIVVIKEQLEPFSNTNPASGIKYPNNAAKLAGLACTVGGKPVYRDTFYTMDETLEDTLCPHDNGAQISAFVASMNKANTPALTNATPAPVAETKGRGGRGR